MTYLDDLKVELVPQRYRRPFGAWESGDWTEVQTPYGSIHDVKNPQCNRDSQEIGDSEACHLDCYLDL